MWDNAYCIHEFDGDFVPFPDILDAVPRGTAIADMVYEFASTSKVTLPGAGISCHGHAPRPIWRIMRKAHRHPDHLL